MPGWVTLAYSDSAAAAGATNDDQSAAADADFSRRNSHYIFTEPYNLLGAFSLGASLTRGRFQVPKWNAIGEFTLSRANRSATVPTNGVWDNWMPDQMEVPQNEELQVQWSNNLGAATEQESTLLLLATKDWTANLPTGILQLQARATFTVTPTVNAWSGPQTISLSQSLRGGVYALIGCMMQGTNSAFFRVIFPRYRLYHGRKLRPGGPVQNAIGDFPFFNFQKGSMSFGEWGRFHTFELPQFEVFGLTAASTTYQVFMDLVFLGEDISQLNQGLGGGY